MDFNQPGMGADMVKPGGWQGALASIKNFGGIADTKRARSMAQIQYDLHDAKSSLDVENNRTKQIDTASAKAAGETTLLKNSASIGLSTAKKYASAKVGKDTRAFGMVNGKRTRIGPDERQNLHAVVATTRAGKVSVQGQKRGNLGRNKTETEGDPITTTPGDKPDTSSPGANPSSAGKKPRIKKTTAKKPTASQPGMDNPNV